MLRKWRQTRALLGIVVILAICFSAVAQAAPLDGAVDADAGTATITIVKQSLPQSPRNFRFYGPFGEFRLDNPQIDDVDGIGDRMSYTVIPGTYGFSELQVDGWRLTEIVCNPSARATINLPQHSVMLTVQAGDNVACTFVNQHAVTVWARAYWDKNANRIYDVIEPWKSGVWTEVFNAEGKRIEANFTDVNGQVGKFNLVPGSYTMCQTPPSGWWNTQPGKLDPRYGKPCYTFTLNAGGLVTGYFGWIDRPFVVPAEEEGIDVGGLEMIPEEMLEEEAVGSRILYLPIVAK